MSVFRKLGHPAMGGLATALEGGRVAPPFHRSQLQGHVSDELVEEMLDELRDLSGSGMAPRHIAYMLRLLAKERGAAQAIADRVELVWSGTEVMAGGSRDTAVVVQELFREAKESVLIASYALDAGNKAKALFEKLAARMDAEQGLRVRLFVNVQRKYRDETAVAVLLREFADTFRHEVWPGERFPEVFYDPRSLAADGNTRACLHAKCIVVDDERALITSANFTEAAHERNIEAGTVITDAVLARALRAQFDTLVDHGVLKRVPGLTGGR
jgi:phosphatidylserine/phosphatidylglycerophosphate/cardiolipin synthase-like enzyme